MILLLGSGGYIGGEFYKYLIERQLSHVLLKYEDCTENILETYIREYKITHVINATGYTGKPNVDACEFHKKETIYGNIIFLKMIIDVCERCDTILVNISSGCIYTGKNSEGRAFTENDSPNFTFEQNNCSFYSGTKAIGESLVQTYPKSYNLRLRIPFDNVNNGRNYITKLMSYNTLLNVENSISNKREFVEASMRLLELKAPYGIYNIVNTGAITTLQITELLNKTIGKDKKFKFFENEKSFYELTKSTPRSNCVLDNSKILSCGITLDTAEESLLKCLNNWKA